MKFVAVQLTADKLVKRTIYTPRFTIEGLSDVALCAVTQSSQLRAVGNEPLPIIAEIEAYPYRLPYRIRIGFSSMRTNVYSLRGALTVLYEHPWTAARILLILVP